MLEPEIGRGSSGPERHSCEPAMFFFVLFFCFLPLFVKLENYDFGKWSQTMNKVKCFIFYEKNSECILQMNSTDNTALLTVLLANHITSCDNVFLIGFFLFTT
jgi:hypothetical protein